MRLNHVGPVLVLAAALIGCDKMARPGPEGLPTVAQTPPPAQGPAVPGDATLRPNYQFAGQPPAAAGTAFVVADKAGKLYMLTAAHVMDDEAEWNTVQGVSLTVMGGGPAANVQGRPLHVGKSFDVAGTGADLVIWPLAAGAKASPLKLAAEDAKQNEWVWAVGQEPGSSGPQKMYRCQVTGAEDGGLLLVQHDPFQMRGFSGGPVVNARGEVVGSLLGGQGKQVIMSRASAIREKLAQAQVQLP